MLIMKFLGIVLVTCHTIVLASTDFSVSTSGLSTWNQSSWTLTAEKYVPGQYQSRMSLSNGYVGASLAAAGPFFEYDVNQTDPSGAYDINVWPLFSRRLSFSTISGFYDIQTNASGTNYPWLNQYGYESFISGIPHPTGLIFSFGDSFLDSTASNTSLENFKSSINFKTGVASWDYTWAPEMSNSKFNISFTTIFSRERPNVIAISASITSEQDIQGTVTDILDGRSAVRSYSAGKGLCGRQSIFSAVHPNGLANITAFVVSTAAFENAFTDISSRHVATGPFTNGNISTIGQSFNISLKAGKKATFYKYVGVASNDKFHDPHFVATKASKSAWRTGFNGLVSEHAAAWGEIMTESAIDNFTDPTTGLLPNDPVVQSLQIASVANTFYILQNLQPDGSGLNDNSIAVGGLASESYAGLIFWDADYWIAPSVSLSFPGYSKQISNFRLKQHPQALANAAFNEYPNGSALYSWTAGRYGNCTGTGPCVDYEYHLNYDLVYNMLQLYNITQDQTWWNSGPRQVVESVAIMTSHLLQYNSTTKSYWIRNMTDPDEFANNVDNGAFTIASASKLLGIANGLRRRETMAINETWAAQTDVEFPQAPSNITLEYQTMNGSVKVKQADVILLTYPLNYNEKGFDDGNKLMDLDFYSNRQSPDGPAMTYGMFAITANSLSPSGCAAYTYTVNGFLSYLRAPWYQFSEQNDDDVDTNGDNHPAFPFLTGHGGASQVAPFGFLGIRTDQDILIINPSLPPQIPHLKLRSFYFAGTGLSATMNTTHTVLSRFSTASNPAIFDIYANTTMPIRIGTASQNTISYLAINASLTIPNRQYFTNKTYPGNLLQCLPVSSTSKNLPGQLPLSVNDGATATRWQPFDNTTASSVSINTTSVPFQPISTIYLDWGTRPPRNATVFVGNRTAAAGVTETAIEIGPIMPNAVVSNGVDVKPYAGNTTTFVLKEVVWSGEWARLEVEGCWTEDGEGATVGEFIIAGK